MAPSPVLLLRDINTEDTDLPNEPNPISGHSPSRRRSRQPRPIRPPNLLRSSFRTARAKMMPTQRRFGENRLAMLRFGHEAKSQEGVQQTINDADGDQLKPGMTRRNKFP